MSSGSGRTERGRKWPAGPALLLLILALLFSGALVLHLGSSKIAPAEIWRILRAEAWERQDLEPQATIVLEIRLPRLCLAILIGASLAVAGAVMQTLFQNPLADPYVLGSASGAGLGAVLAVGLLPSAGWLGSGVPALSAFAGALGATGLVYLLARRSGGVPASVLLLTGVAVGGLLQALMTYFLLWQRQSQSHELLHWLMGSLSGATWSQVQIAAVSLALGLVLLQSVRTELDILAFGDEEAYHLGVSLERLKLLALAAAALLVAVAVALCGVIAFVGLLVPHGARRLVGPRHGLLLPASALLGGILLLWADALASVAVPATEIPLSVITSAAGCLVFLLVLARSKRLA